MEQKRLFLLDAYALIFRAYYALIKMPRITKDGFNTSAIFGFVNTLEDLLKKENPTHIAVCFDPKGPTFRNEAFDGYKADRAETPEDIRLAIPYIKNIIKAYNIPVVEVAGYEADDVIGTLAKAAEKEGFTTYMMTPDKDFGQLVSPNIFQYKPPYRGQDFEVRGEKEVCEKYGLNNTLQVIDLLALMGDKIDNIPGCPGVGEKTAVKLIQEYGSTENIIANASNIKGAIGKKIAENVKQIEFSKYLATICTDAPVNITPNELIRKEVDKEALFSIFKELEFKTLIDRVGRRLSFNYTPTGNAEEPKPTGKKETSSTAAPSLFDDFDFDAPEEIQTSTFENSAHNYIIVDSEEKLKKLVETVVGLKECGVALIADGENDATSSWVATAIATAKGTAFLIPANFKDGKTFILSLFKNQEIQKISCNSKRDYVVAARQNNSTNSLINYFDVALAHYILQPELRHNIDDLADAYLNYQVMSQPTPDGAKKITKTFVAANISTEKLVNWACEIADLTLQLKTPLLKYIESNNLSHLFFEVELPLVKVLADMELTGVRIDVEALDEAAKNMEQRINTLEKEIHELAGEEFNVGSPAKVGEILFDKLQLDPKAKKTKTGQYSTSEEVLEKLSIKHPIINKILEFRALRKLLSTYLVALPANINPETGKVHTNYNQTVTATGRISSSSPNLQNIPVRDNEGKEIRRAFIADAGHLFLSADYSQIELRLVADFANDEIMLDAFKHDKDIHAITAAKIYHKLPEEVTDSERRKAKTANFGILYGISAFGLANRLSIPRAEAKELIDNYFATFPTIHNYMEESIQKARLSGFVTTKMGRKRMLPDINSKNPVVRGYAERNAINAPIQGSAADIIKVAMVNIATEMERLHLKSKMIMQVHDELNFDVYPEELETMKELVQRLMPAAYSGNVTLSASCGVASNWLDAH